MTTPLIAPHTAKTKITSWESLNYRLLVTPKLLYFWIGCLLNVFNVFRSSFFREYLGFDSELMGYVMTFFSLGSILGVTLWSRLADVFKVHRWLLISLCLAIPAIFELIMVTRWLPQEWWLRWSYLVFGLLGLVSGGVSPLLDFQVLSLLQMFNVEQASYGRQVLAGTIGYGLTTKGLGWLIGVYGSHIILYILPIVSIITVTIIFLFGVSSPEEGKEKEPSLISTAATSKQSPSVLGYVRIIATPRFLLFLSVILAIGMGRQIMDLYLPAYFREGLKLEDDQIGNIFLYSSLFTMVLLFSGPHILKRLGVRPMLLVGLGAMTLRLGAYTFIRNEKEVIAVELLKSISFGFTHMGGVREAALCAPEGWETTFQAIYTTAYVQVPAVLGSLFGGYLYKEYTGYKLLQGTSFVSAAAFVIFAVFVVVTSFFGTDRPCRGGYCVKNEPGCEKP